MARKRTIACIEGWWEADLHKSSSIRSLAEFAASSTECGLIYRQVGTPHELIHVLSRLRGKRYQDISLIYLGFHGKPGALKFGRRVVTLARVAEALGRTCRKRHILFGTCRTLAIGEDKIQAFLRRTAAQSVAGYQKSPDWLEGSALDLLAIEMLLWHDTPQEASEWLRRNCAGLVDLYGFTIYTKAA